MQSFWLADDVANMARKAANGESGKGREPTYAARAAAIGMLYTWRDAQKRAPENQALGSLAEEEIGRLNRALQTNDPRTIKTATAESIAKTGKAHALILQPEPQGKSTE